MLHIIEGLAQDWHRLDERIEALSVRLARWPVRIRHAIG
jgi:hypothetical protein